MLQKSYIYYNCQIFFPSVMFLVQNGIRLCKGISVQLMKQSRARTQASGMRAITLCLLDIDWHPIIVNILSIMSCFPIHISNRVVIIIII